MCTWKLIIPFFLIQLLPRRLPTPNKDRVKAETGEMSQNRILEKVTKLTAWISALLAVLKPDGKLRICIDLKH
jgi:hypothetical protein